MSDSILSQRKGERRGGNRSLLILVVDEHVQYWARDMWTRQRTPQKKQSRCRGTERQKIIDRERIILAGPSTLFSVKCSGGERKWSYSQWLRMENMGQATDSSSHRVQATPMIRQPRDVAQLTAASGNLGVWRCIWMGVCAWVPLVPIGKGVEAWTRPNRFSLRQPGSSARIGTQHDQHSID